MTTTMIAPTTEMTIVLRSSGPWIGSFTFRSTPARKPPSKRADDTEHDMANDPEPLVALDEEPGEIAGDRAKHDPGDQVHVLTSVVVGPG